MSNAIQNGANISTIVTTLLAVVTMAVGWLWRVSQGLAQHHSRLEALEASIKKAETEQAEILRSQRENAERLARIETDVKWLRDTLGGERRR